MTKSSENVRRMVLCAMFTALVAVCSQIAVPMPWGVPINLALFAVYMAGTILVALRGDGRGLCRLLRAGHDLVHDPDRG